MRGRAGTACWALVCGVGTHLQNGPRRQLDGRAGACDSRSPGQWQGSGRRESSSRDRQALSGRQHHGGQGARQPRRHIRGGGRQHFWQGWGEDGSGRGHCRYLGGDIHDKRRRVAKQDLGAQGTGTPIGGEAFAKGTWGSGMGAHKM